MDPRPHGLRAASREAAQRRHRRDIDSNDELAAAAVGARQRVAQESFTPESFLLRRSMPWGDVREHGLYFVAYAATLDPFERILRHHGRPGRRHRRRAAQDVAPVTGGYFWCPPVAGKHLDLRALGV